MSWDRPPTCWHCKGLAEVVRGRDGGWRQWRTHRTTDQYCPTLSGQTHRRVAALRRATVGERTLHHYALSPIIAPSHGRSGHCSTQKDRTTNGYQSYSSLAAWALSRSQNYARPIHRLICPLWICPS
eukprot:4004115-Pyramimonas_sp.AAC.1